MTATREVLSALFDAENRRDWEHYVEFFHPDVEWTVGGRIVRGREDYVRAIQRAYAGSGVQFRQHQIISSEDETVVATLLVDSAGQRSLDIFEFEDGQVRREREFLLGPGEDWTADVLEFRCKV